MGGSSGLLEAVLTPYYLCRSGYIEAPQGAEAASVSFAYIVKCIRR